MTRVFIADSCVLSRLATRWSLLKDEDVVVVGETDDGSDALRLVGELRPDVVVMDLSLEGLDGLEAMLILKRHIPTLKVVILSSWTEPSDVVCALTFGADAFCSLENLESLTDAIKAVSSGGTWIDPELPIRQTFSADSRSGKLTLAIRACPPSFARRTA